MSVQSPACQQFCSELLTAPMESVDHRIGEYVSSHTDGEVLDLVYTMLDEDPPSSRAHEIARGLWPFVRDIAQDVLEVMW